MSEELEPAHTQEPPIEPDLTSSQAETRPAPAAPEEETQPPPAKPEAAPPEEPESSAESRPRASALDRFKRKDKAPAPSKPKGRIIPLPIAVGLVLVPFLGALASSESGFTYRLGGVFVQGTADIIGFLGSIGEAEETEPEIVAPPPPPVIPDRPAYTPPPPPRSRPAQDRSGVTASDTGAFWFICRQGHEDWEAIISTCPSCGTKDRLYQDPSGQGIFCFSCKKKLASSALVCDRCNNPPAPGSRLKLKRR